MDIELDKKLNTQIKTIEEFAMDWAHKVQLRFEEIQVQNASTEALLKCKEKIDNELKKRGAISF